MARRINLSRLKSQIREMERKQKRAVDDYNRAVRDFNRKTKQAVDNYNREVRAHNARVRANRQRLLNELGRLGRGARSARLTSFRSSSQTLHHRFTRVELRVQGTTPSAWQDRFLDLSENETANSIAVLNALDGQSADVADDPQPRLTDTAVTNELAALSEDLDRRWRGALFALDPQNPDAGRHFCVSAREVFTRFLELCAPDAEVFVAYPTCDRQENGRPTRRARIRLLLSRKNAAANEFEDFVDQDVQNILDLFRVFNDGTHGSPGKFSMHQLRSVKRRVEDGILFLGNLVG